MKDAAVPIHQQFNVRFQSCCTTCVTLLMSSSGSTREVEILCICRTALYEWQPHRTVLIGGNLVKCDNAYEDPRFGHRSVIQLFPAEHEWDWRVHTWCKSFLDYHEDRKTDCHTSSGCHVDRQHVQLIAEFHSTYRCRVVAATSRNQVALRRIYNRAWVANIEMFWLSLRQPRFCEASWNLLLCLTTLMDSLVNQKPYCQSQDSTGKCF